MVSLLGIANAYRNSHADGFSPITRGIAQELRTLRAAKQELRDVGVVGPDRGGMSTATVLVMAQVQSSYDAFAVLLLVIEWTVISCGFIAMLVVVMVN
jgi:hypothetical protein